MKVQVNGLCSCCGTNAAITTDKVRVCPQCDHIRLSQLMDERVGPPLPECGARKGVVCKHNPEGKKNKEEPE